MKAVIFAGGAATRLEGYIGRNYNKHLLPLGKTLVIEKGVRDLLIAGATEFYVITNSGWEDDFRTFFSERLRLGRSRATVVASQSPSLPLPDVLLQAKDFVGRESFILYLGDNLFLDSPAASPATLIASLRARDRFNYVVLTLSAEPSQFGVVRFHHDHRHCLVDRIEEKPQERGEVSRLVVTGLAKYTSEVFMVARRLVQKGDPKRSLSDIHTVLLRERKLRFVAWPGPWFDIGTPKRYKMSLHGMSAVYGQLEFDLSLCPRAELLERTLLPEIIDEFTWKTYERFR